MKKALSVILLLALLSGLLVVPAHAATSGYLTYYVVDGEARIAKCDPSVSGNIVIPESLGGYPVNGILSYAFDGCTGLTGVTIPDSVTFIDEFVFRNCTNLKTVTLGKGVNQIGRQSFYNCSGLEQINLNSVNLRNVSDGSQLFYNAGQSSGGIVVNIGKEVTRIPAYLFYTGYSNSNTPKVTRVNFAEGSVCKEIGTAAFKNCTALEEFTVPEKVVTIGTEAFYNCVGMKRFQFNATDMDDLASGNKLFTSTYDTQEATSVSIGKNVTRIPAYLFCSGLGTTEKQPIFEKVVFEEGSACKEIGARAFSSMKGLTELIIPEGVTFIDTYAIMHCADLVRLSVPDSLEVCGEAIISGCDKLEYTTFDNARYLGNAVNPYVILVDLGERLVGRDFAGCKIHENTKIIYKEAFSGAKGLSELIVPEGVRQICSYAFTSSDLAVISIPETAKRLEITTFKNCDKLVYNIYESGKYLGNAEKPYMILAGTTATDITQLDIHEDTKIIHHDALAYCNKLTYVAIPEGVERIGYRNSHYLTSVYIPASVTVITEDAFFYGTIKDVYYGGTLQQKGNMQYCDSHLLRDNVTWHYNSKPDRLYTAGDLDGDGEITDWDGVLLARYLAGWKVEIDLAAADIDGDGEVSDWDGVVLDRYLAGWNVTIG